MSDLISPLVYQLGIGGVGGFIVGFALKKLSKLIIMLIGIFIIALIYLSTQGIININYDRLFTAILNLFGQAGEALSWFVHVISIMPFIGSFIASFLLGFKLG